jgi:hypothetical protein
MPDVYHPQWREHIRAKIKAKAGTLGDDPWLLGVFIHNEMHWGRPDGFAEDLLRAAGDVVGKRVYADRLAEHFGDIGAFNQAMGTAIASWQDLVAQPIEGKLDMTPLADINREHYRAMCERYFSINREAMDEFMPGTLYLGCRWHGIHGNEVNVDVASNYVDVLSFNRYTDTVDTFTYPGSTSQIDLPFLVSEFQFCAMDRGQFGTGLHYAADQRNRGEKYQHFLRSAMAHPKCVGTHYFMWMDGCVAGFKGGESANSGLLSITDRPFYEFIDIARRTHQNLYERRTR